MKRLMMISGPALGHVARLSLVASELISAGKIHIDFVVAGFCQHMALAEKAGCRVMAVNIAETDRKFPAVPFADQVEGLFEDRNPDLIIKDCNPLRWLPAILFPNCPRVVITNAFLTGHAGLETHQTIDLERKRPVIDKMRMERGLPKLETVFDLYEGDRTLLADPAPLAQHFAPWPAFVENCGPLCLESGGSIPEALADLTDIALFSMGSTGGLEAYLQIAKNMQTARDIGPTVYVGSQSEAARETGVFDFCFDWLPLTPVLQRCHLVVTHGGTGSTYLALSEGVPVLVSPKHANHALLADCLEALGVGGHLGDHPDLTEVTRLRSNLDKFEDGFEHRSAPSNHANAIIGLL